MDLSSINVSTIVRSAFFQTPSVSEKVLRFAEPGISEFERAVTMLLEQNVSDYSVRLDDLAVMMGMSGKILVRHIMAAQRIAIEYYDGEYDPPIVVDPEMLLYGVTAIVLSEVGRVSEDIDTYTVYRFFDEVFNVGETPSDMLCYHFMMRYFTQCLKTGYTPIYRFIKNEVGGVTPAKLNTWLKKQPFYEDERASEDFFGIPKLSPTLADVSKLGYSYFVTLKDTVDIFATRRRRH